MPVQIEIRSNKDEVKRSLAEVKKVALEKIGLVAVRYAKMKVHVDTGRLRNSITYATANGQRGANDSGGQFADAEEYAMHGNADDKSVYIGTNVKYAPYLELGRKSKSGKMTAYPFLKPAIANHVDEYRKLIIDELKRPI